MKRKSRNESITDLAAHAWNRVASEFLSDVCSDTDYGKWFALHERSFVAGYLAGQRAGKPAKKAKVKR